MGRSQQPGTHQRPWRGTPALAVALLETLREALKPLDTVKNPSSTSISGHHPSLRAPQQSPHGLERPPCPGHLSPPTSCLHTSPSHPPKIHFPTPGRWDCGHPPFTLSCPVSRGRPWKSRPGLLGSPAHPPFRGHTCPRLWACPSLGAHLDCCCVCPSSTVGLSHRTWGGHAVVLRKREGRSPPGSGDVGSERRRSQGHHGATHRSMKG